MPNFASQFATGQLSTVSSGAAGVVISNDFFHDLTVAQNVTGNIIDIGTLPAYMTISDVVLVPDDLDSLTAMTLDVGIMSGTPGDTTSVRTCGAEVFAASTAAQTGAVARPTLKSAFNILPTETDRSIGVKIAAQAGTPVAGRIRLRVFMHAADHRTAF